VCVCVSVCVCVCVYFCVYQEGCVQILFMTSLSPSDNAVLGQCQVPEESDALRSQQCVCVCVCVCLCVFLCKPGRMCADSVHDKSESL
jgi:hypothetical protein